MRKLFNISELSKILNLINPKTKKPLNHIIRYWEKEFSILRSKKINKRRHYTPKQIELFKMIKFMLKNEGMTISGVKKILKKKINKLDDDNSYSLKSDYQINTFKSKSKKILEKIQRLKNYGKKNSS